MLSALSHGLDVIEFLAKERRPVSLGAISAAIGIGKSGTHRILGTLAARGFVVRSEGGIYELGYRLWEFAWAAPGVQLVTRATPVMQRMADAIGDGATLGAINDGFDVVYLHVVESRQTVRVYVETGSRLPAHITATGLACLAYLPSDRLQQILPERLEAFTPNTLTDKAELLRELQRVRTRGYARTKGTFRPDVGGIAAPIFDGEGKVVAALCVSSPTYRIDTSWTRRVSKAVISAAQEISGFPFAGGLGAALSAA